MQLFLNPEKVCKHNIQEVLGAFTKHAERVMSSALVAPWLRSCFRLSLSEFHTSQENVVGMVTFIYWHTKMGFSYLPLTAE